MHNKLYAMFFSYKTTGKWSLDILALSNINSITSTCTCTLTGNNHYLGRFIVIHQKIFAQKIDDITSAKTQTKQASTKKKKKQFTKT